jgi:hypothetical protein
MPDLSQRCLAGLMMEGIEPSRRSRALPPCLTNTTNGEDYTTPERLG